MLAKIKCLSEGVAPIAGGKLPPTLASLDFGDSFNKPLDNLPTTLQHLTVGRTFNNRITFPPKLTHLTLGYWFNQDINVPNTITHLSFGNQFTKLVDLTSSIVEVLNFGEFFNQPINLPITLKKLKFGRHFDQQLILPKSVTHLIFGGNYSHLLELSSSSIEELEFMGFGRTITPPCTLKVLRYKECYGPINFPPQNSVTHLQLGSFEFTKDYCQAFTNLTCLTHLTVQHMREVNNLPDSITHFTLEGDSEKLTLPPKLISLDIRSCKLPECFLPTTLQRLNVGLITERTLPNITQLYVRDMWAFSMEKLPCTLTHIIFHGLDKPIDNLPVSLTHLTLGNNFNKPIDHLLSSLTHLIIGNRFNQPINHLPSLIFLKLGNRFKQPTQLPSSITELEFCHHIRGADDDTYFHVPPHIQDITIHFYQTINFGLANICTMRIRQWRQVITISDKK